MYSLRRFVPAAFCNFARIKNLAILSSCGHTKSHVYRAAILKEFEKPLVIEQVLGPKELKENQVRLAVHFCSLNYTDVKAFQGGGNLKLPVVVGSEFSGEILEVGNEVTNFQIGDRVVAIQGDLLQGGGLAGQAVVDQSNVWSLSNISLKNAAILPYGHGTALLAFTKFCPLNENDIVIVIAGPAGLGLGAIEVASSVFKAKVIAVCDSSDSSALIREEGAFQAILMSEGYPNVYKQLKKALGETRAHVIYDAVNPNTLHVFQDFLRKDGKLVSVFPLFDKEAFKDGKPDVAINKKLKIETAFEQPIEDRIQHIDLLKFRTIDQQYYRQVISDTLSLYEDDLISAHVSEVFPLERLDEAIEYILKKKCTGKVLIEVKDPVKKKPKEKRDD